MVIERKVKYVDAELLVKLDRGKSRGLRRLQLDEKKRFPVMWSMVHNDEEIRACVLVSDKTGVLSNVMIDLPFEVYDALPSVEVKASSRKARR